MGEKRGGEVEEGRGVEGVGAEEWRGGGGGEGDV